MSKEITKDFDGNRPFEERVFARFDAVDEYLRTLDSRVQNLDSRVQNLDSRVQVLESRAYDTKPIWERALKEILESRLEFGELKGETTGIKSKVTDIETEVNELKREVKREVTNRLDQIQSIQLGNRVDIRDAQDRIDKLESRLA